MFISSSSELPKRGEFPPVWKLVCAFLVVYFGYGLNFLAVKVGVETMPPFLFAGAHVFLAGAVIMGWALFCKAPLAIGGRGLLRAAVSSFFLFVGGVGLVTLGEKLGIGSGMAAVIKASVPLWVVVLEALRPAGEKANFRVVCGVLLGAAGVAIMLYPELHFSSRGGHPLGALSLVCSAFLFAVGALFVRHAPPSESVLCNVAWQMVFGGCFLLAIGLVSGEASVVRVEDVTPHVIGAFLFLWLIHSVAAFSAMNWLLSHLPAPVVTTKFFVSPLIAMVAGKLVLGEAITVSKVVSVAMILLAVAGILWFGKKGKAEALRPDDLDELED